MNLKKWYLAALIFCFIYLLVLQLIAIWPFTIDDMYISLRYAKHWAEGYGLVWNLTEEPVEGYSNFSFVALASLAIRLGYDPVILLKAVNAFSLVLSTLAIYYLSRLWSSRWLAFIPCLWLLSYRGEILWASSGLETIFYQALICFSLLFLLRGIGYNFYPEQRKNPHLGFIILAGFVLALAGFTRPEAVAIMALFGGLALVDRPTTMRREYFKQLSLAFLVCLLIYVPYFFWRYAYFGRLFPNPVYCKTFSGVFALLDKRYLSLALPLFCLSIPAIFRAKDKRHYFFWLPSLMYLVLLINADTVSAFENRLFLPVFALLLPLAFFGLCILVNYFWTKIDEIYYAIVLMSSFWIAILFLHPLSLNDYRYFTINPQIGLELRNKVLDWINHNVAANSHVVLADSGQIPYLSSLSYIDSYCLNNKEMTKVLNKDMYEVFGDEIFIKKPEVLILTSLRADNGEITYTPADLCLHKKLKDDKTYQYRTIVQENMGSGAYRYEIYTLRN